MKILGLDHPTFRPVWVRVAVVVFCAAWSLTEFIFGDLRWAVGISVLAIICVYAFAVIDYDTPDGPNDGGS